VFNVLGPLINPARATNQLIGVYSPHWTAILARVLHNLGTQHVLVVHGRDGLDEVTTTDTTLVSEMQEGGVFSEYEIAPEDFGFRRSRPDDLLGGTLAENVNIIAEVLHGKQGRRRDIVLLNAACALYAANLSASIKEAVALASVSIDSGKALEKLQLLKEYSHAGS
jgi:anthranilate phosphoribosyltransferase